MKVNPKKFREKLRASMLRESRWIAHWITQPKGYTTYLLQWICAMMVVANFAIMMSMLWLRTNIVTTVVTGSNTTLITNIALISLAGICLWTGLGFLFGFKEAKARRMWEAAQPH